MNLTELLKIVDEEENEYDYGGDDSEEGDLLPGIPDFDRIRHAIKKYAREKGDAIII